MSGFAGIIRPDGGAATVELIRAMAAAIPAPSHADTFNWQGEDAALTHRPLYSTAQALEAEQPLATVDGHLVVVLHGYLANHAELTAMLRQAGSRLRSAADAELVLQAYRLWGRECASRIDGEFAFAIWDTKQRELFCVRDHQGLRPFYYHFDGIQLAFGSSTGAVVAALGREPQPNPGFMAEIMSDRWYSIDETVWREVKRLPPAHNLQLAGGQLSIKRYWSLPTEVTLNYRSDGEYFEHYREVFADCVKRASRTHSPLAVEVSGGLDSSAIFVMANALMKRGELGSHELRGYTLRGPEGSPADEQRFVDAVARTTGRHISSFPLARPPLSWFNEQARQYRDIPTYPNGAMSLEMDQQLVADGCMVKLTGVGGDQWLDGSRRYYGEALRGGDAAGFMTSLRADLRDLGKPRTAELVARGFLRPLVPARLRAKLRQHTSDPHAENLDEYWLSPEMRAELDRRSKARDDSLPNHDRDRHKVQKLTFPFLPLALDLIERQSASLGFETRHPMLSRKFIEFSATTPERMRLRGSVGKYIHRRALVGILPREIAERNCKAEFSTTFDGNLEGIHALLVEAQNTGFECLVERDKIHNLMEAWGELSIDETPIWKLWGIYVIAALYLHSKMA